MPDITNPAAPDGCEPQTEAPPPIREEGDQQIIDFGSITASGARGVIHCLSIIGQVEGHYILPPQNKTTKYEHIIPQLVAIEESPTIEGLLIMLNTVGGDVEAGLAISEMIAGMQKPTVSIVLGGGHSIGVPLAVSARRSFIVPSGTMTVHPVRLSGLMVGVPQTYNYFEKVQDRIIRFIVSHSRVSDKRIRELMFKVGEIASDAGTVLGGSEAVDEGIIDSLGSLSDALECLYGYIEENRAKSELNNLADEQPLPKAAPHRIPDGNPDKTRPSEPMYTPAYPGGAPLSEPVSGIGVPTPIDPPSDKPGAIFPGNPRGLPTAYQAEILKNGASSISPGAPFSSDPRSPFFSPQAKDGGAHGRLPFPPGISEIFDAGGDP